MEYKVIPHKDVKKDDEKLLKQAKLFDKYLTIISDLKGNPYSRKYNMEKLNPKKKEIFSKRINAKHRVIYTVDNSTRTVKIWSAWTHYQNKRI